MLKYLAKHLKVILPAIIDTFDLKKDRLIIKILYYKIVFWASKFAFFARRRPTMVGGAGPRKLGEGASGAKNHFLIFQMLRLVAAHDLGPNVSF